MVFPAEAELKNKRLGIATSILYSCHSFCGQL